MELAKFAHDPREVAASVRQHRRVMAHVSSLLLVGCACLSLGSCSEGSSDPDTVARKPTGPNILFLAIDDLRIDLGCYGAEHVISPNIDALATRGVVFDRAYVQVAVCNPSRVSMLTGMRPDTTGVYALPQPFRRFVPEALTLPQYFARRGWHSVGIGKIHHQPYPDPVSWSEPKWRVGEGTPSATDPLLRRNRAYWNWSEAQQRELAAWRQRARAAGRPEWHINRLRGHATNDEDVEDHQRYAGAMTHTVLGRLPELAAREEPFFLAVGYVLPHLPFTPPKRYWDRYDRDELPLVDEALPEGAPRITLNTMYELRDYVDFADCPKPWEGSLDEADARRLTHGYLAAVTYVDAQIGHLLEGLEATGEADDTVVVLWSDHGWKLGHHNAWGKMTNYEEDTRIPLVIYDPRAKANGRRCERLVEALDLFPTLCELAGLPLPEQLEGRSLAPLLKDPDQPWAEAAYSQYLRDDPGDWHENMVMGHSARTSSHRYVAWRDHETGELLAEELYDHRGDPRESRNVLEDPAQADFLRRGRELEHARWPR